MDCIGVLLFKADCGNPWLYKWGAPVQAHTCRRTVRQLAQAICPAVKTEFSDKVQVPKMLEGAQACDGAVPEKGGPSRLFDTCAR